MLQSVRLSVRVSDCLILIGQKQSVLGIRLLRNTNRKAHAESQRPPTPLSVVTPSVLQIY